jgi:FkbM family methyltransferase
VSFADWATESRQRFHHQPTGQALQETLTEFRRGFERRALAAVFAVVGKHTMKTRLAGVHASFIVENATDVERARSLNREEVVAEWLLQDVDDDSVFWDIGAYHGHYSVLASHLGASVTAFEPDSENRQRLQENTREINPAATPTIVPKALSRENAVIEDFGSDTAGSEAIGGGSQRVETRRGDDLDGYGQPTHVKIDVEGHELAVLDGLVETLRGVDRIVIEVHDDVTTSMVRDYLRPAGLDVERLDSPRSQTHLGGVRR